MLTDIGAIVGIVSGAVVIIVAIIGIVKSGFNIFNKINKIDNIEKGNNALLLIHRNELFTLYRDQIKLVFNPTHSPFPDKEELLAKLERGHLLPAEADKLTQILKYEESEAKRKDNQMAVLAIGALILLILLISKK
jgi:hypothetical protein